MVQKNSVVTAQYDNVVFSFSGYQTGGPMPMPAYSSQPGLQQPPPTYASQPAPQQGPSAHVSQPAPHLAAPLQGPTVHVSQPASLQRPAGYGSQSVPHQPSTAYRSQPVTHQPPMPTSQPQQQFQFSFQQPLQPSTQQSGVNSIHPPQPSVHPTSNDGAVHNPTRVAEEVRVTAETTTSNRGVQAETPRRGKLKRVRPSHGELFCNVPEHHDLVNICVKFFLQFCSLNDI